MVRRKKIHNKNYTILKLPYINDVTTRKIKESIKKSGLQIRLIETPGVRLRDLLTDSRPLDKEKCDNHNCRKCQAITSRSCKDRNTIYDIGCKKTECIGIEDYGGETYRPICFWSDEHYLSAANPTAKSYTNKPFAKHYASKHPGETPELELIIIGTGRNLKNRKIKEAKYIHDKQPTLNDKKELNDVTQFLV